MKNDAGSDGDIRGEAEGLTMQGTSSVPEEPMAVTGQMRCREGLGDGEGVNIEPSRTVRNVKSSQDEEKDEFTPGYFKLALASRLEEPEVSYDIAGAKYFSQLCAQ
jgi:hypothetical protein